ncbi:MAG: hypothetical protein ACK56F_10775, partial [bacterium]
MAGTVLVSQRAEEMLAPAIGDPSFPCAPSPPALAILGSAGGGCCRVAKLHPDWWWRCPPERWGWWSNRLREWGSPAPHGSIVGD